MRNLYKIIVTSVHYNLLKYMLKEGGGIRLPSAFQASIIVMVLLPLAKFTVNGLVNPPYVTFTGKTT